jgi:hypothetical protein
MTCRKRRDEVKTAGSRYCGISSDETWLRAERPPALRWPELAKEAAERNVGTWRPDANGEAASGSPTRASVRRRVLGAEPPVVARNSPTKGGSEGVRVMEPAFNEPTRKGRSR